MEPLPMMYWTSPYRQASWICSNLFNWDLSVQGPSTFPPQTCSKLFIMKLKQAVGILLECPLVVNIIVNNKSVSGIKYMYRSGTVNSKSFVGKVLLRIKRKFELTYAL